MSLVTQVSANVGRLAFGVKYLLRTRRGKKSVLSHLAAPARRPVPWPTFVQFRVTNLCNLRCKMCGQWGDTGVFRASDAALASDGEHEKQRIRELIGLRRQLSLADYTAVLDQIAPHQPIVSLFGGEPFLYPDILPLIREVKRRGLTLTVITNGFHLERHARELVESGIDAIAVSIDGPPALHDAIRGQAGSFARAAEGVRAIERWRRKLGRPLPIQLAILPVTELNIEEMGAAVEELRRLPLENINVGLRWFVPSDVGADYERVMREDFGVPGESWKGFDFSWPGGREAARSRQMASLVELLRELRKGRVRTALRGGSWVSFLPGVRPEQAPEYLTEFGKTFGHNLCPVAWYFAQVMPDGDVCFCGDFPDYVIGNVRKQSFEEIWTGPPASRFREKLAREPLPICARCCGNYVYGRWERPRPRV